MLYLHALGHFHPEIIITNKFLSGLDIGSSEEWIIERVGIHTRHTSLPLDYIKETKNKEPRAALEASIYTNAEIGAAAARMALERAGLRTDEIGMVISGSSAPDYAIPSEAATIASELGIDVPCFDLNSACSSFGAQIAFISKMQRDALPPYVLVVNPEHFTRTVDYSDRRVAPLFGDGSSAAIVSLIVPAPIVIKEAFYDSRPSGWDKVFIPRLGHFSQDGRAVQGFAIRKSTEALRSLQETFSVNGNLKFVGHQANLGMLNNVCERCGIAPKNHWHNVAAFGNTGGASAPCVLSQHWNDIAPGDHIAIVVVGSGLSWGYMMLQAIQEK